MMKTFIIIILIILANVALSVWCVPMKRPMPEEPECPKDWCTCKKRTSMYVTPCLIVNCNTSLNSIQDVNDYLQKLPNQTCKL